MDRTQRPTIDALCELFETYGSDPYDEELSQLDHALQTAALAQTEGAEAELVVSALLHDVGHLLELADGATGPDRDRDLGHEATGARYLAGLFGPGVTGPIALHVRAKRYLCTVDAAYLDSLSAGSRSSLAVQGGTMSGAEVAAFEAHPGFAGALRLRRWDDGGKVEGLDVAPLDRYRTLLEDVAR